MKKRLCKIFAIAACLALAVFGLAACGKKAPNDSGSGDSPSGDTSTKCYAVLARTMTLVENAADMRLVWDRSVNATGYTLVINGSTVTTTDARYSLRNNPAISLPSDKNIDVTIVATAAGKEDSDPTNQVFQAKGNIKLNKPKIKSFENGILEWESDGVKNYTLKVNGTEVKSAGSNYYTATTLDTSSYTGALNVDITAVGDGIYTLDSDKLSFGINAAHSKMTMQTPQNVTVAGGVLTWSEVGGAKGYRVVDVRGSSKYVYPDDATSGVFTYDMTGKVPVFGIYPESDDPSIEDAAVEPMEIKYLEGEGTAASPYLIKTGFDLRTIDYYEAVYAAKLRSGASPAPARNCYKIAADITYKPAAENNSNIYKLSEPFYGTLDGGNKRLSGIDVNYNEGHWALFDEIVAGATVKDIVFDSPEIVNAVRDPKLPINASIAAVAYSNGGTISGIKVVNASFKAAGGEISGICSHNYGTVSGCEISGNFKQNKVGLVGEACYESAGIVLENKAGGTVTGNKVNSLSITGTVLPGEGSGTYNNIRTAAGIVAVNRKGGVVSNNSYTSVTINNALNADITEFGGLVAYNAGTVIRGTGTVGTFTCNAPLASVSPTVGKNDGTFN